MARNSPFETTAAESTGLPENDRSKALRFLGALRPHQWSKNLLILIPVVVGHQLRDPARVKSALLAVLAFSICASAVYLINDVLDIGPDREHRWKRSRAFAAGHLPSSLALIAAPLLALCGLGVAWFLNPKFAGYLVTYLAATTVYSLFLKRLAIVDVLLLAGLYTLRITAGGAATAIVISPWLLGFSMFFFLSLALVKRYSELSAADDRAKIPGRGYTAADLPQLNAFGTASGYIAVLVFALYINSPDVGILYSRPLLLWAVCPLLIYWISRVWLLAHRGELHEDPVLFALKDGASYLTGALIAFVILAAL